MQLEQQALDAGPGAVVAAAFQDASPSRPPPAGARPVWLDGRVGSQTLVASSGPVLRALDAEGLLERAPRVIVQEARHLRLASASPTETVVALALAFATGGMARAQHLLAANVAWRFTDLQNGDLLATGRSAVTRLLDRRTSSGDIAHTVEAHGMVLTGGRRHDGDPDDRGRGHVMWTTGGQGRRRRRSASRPAVPGP